MSCIICNNATESDALATALLTDGPAMLSRLSPNARALAAVMKEGQLTIEVTGL